MSRFELSSADQESAHWGNNPWFRAMVGIISLVLLFFLQMYSFPLFHSLIEIITIAVAWGAFILLWNGRKYEIRESFLLLGLALFSSGFIDLMHTISYRGVSIFPSFDAAALSTQFWIGARLVESLGWLGFALFLRRGKLLTQGSLFFGALSLLIILSILVFRSFPTCFIPGEGLTKFKIGMEAGFIIIMLASLLILRRRRAVLDASVFQNLQWALVSACFAEFLFTTYNDAYGLSIVFGHFARLISRFLVYRALIYLSVARPYDMFFHQIKREKDRALQSEERWRSLTLANPDYLLELDTDLKVTFANRPAPGLTLDDVLGQSILGFLPPGEETRIEEILRTALRTGDPISYETQFDSTDKPTKFLDTTVSRRYDGEGNSIGLMLVARDISRRKFREQLAKARLRISNFALEHDTSKVLQKVLDEAETLTLSKIGFFHFMDEDQVHLRLQAWSTRTVNEACQARAAGSHYPLEEAGIWADCIRRRQPIIHNDYQNLPDRKGLPDGHAVVLREMTVPVIRQGKVVAVVGVGNKTADYDEDDLQLLQDLADQAWEIVSHKRAQKELQETQRQLANTLANLPGMVFRCANNADWTMEFLSEGCRDLTGYDSHDLIDNRVVSFASLIHPDDREDVWQQVQDSLDNKRRYQIIYRILPKDQPTKWVWEQGHGVFTDNGLFAIEGFIYDVSDQILAQQEREAMDKKMQESQKLESLGVLAGGIAHDFNNLLQAMLGFAELAQLPLNDDHPSRGHIERVMQAAQKAAGLTDQMLAFSGKGHFTKSRVNLATQLNEMAELIQSTVPKSITLDLALEDPRVEAALDITQLQQVVLNLLTNAAEAIGEDPGTIKMRTGTTHCDPTQLDSNLIKYEVRDPIRPRPGNFVFIEVTDSGCGMDKATLRRVFEPFFTTKFTGRGLGLAAVQGIIRGHGGVMEINSKPGHGTTVCVLFPTMEAESRNSSLTKPRPVSGHQGRPTILIVDDEPDVRSLVSGQLEILGMEPICAVDGQEAMEIFQSHPDRIDLVFLDLVMPRVNGRTCLGQLRELSPDLPVIIMSGFPEKEIRERLTGLEIQGVLAKPFYRDQLKEVLERTLN